VTKKYGDVTAVDDLTVKFHYTKPTSIGERLILRNGIRPDKTFGALAKQVQDLFAAGKTTASDEVKAVRAEKDKLRPASAPSVGPYKIDMASVTGTPLHYFLQTSRGFASGESLKQNETRFLAKVRDRQISFGQTWAELMSFALRLAGRDGVELVTDWEDPSPTTEKDILENLLLKKQLGISTEQALKEAGYGDVDVKRMADKNQ
jgi:ABC-type transport system substrate-binding protein